MFCFIQEKSPILRGFRRFANANIMLEQERSAPMASFKEIQEIYYGENGLNRLSLRFQPSDVCFHSHWHERLEILHITNGEIQLYVDENCYIATSGQTVIITPLMTHKGVAGAAGVKYEVITFDIAKFTNASIASRKYLNSLSEQKTTFCPLTEHPEITSAITTLLSWMDEGSSRNPLCCIGKMYEIVGLFYQYCSTESAPRPKPDANFAEVLEYIDKHFTEDITTVEVSKKFGYDNAYFCRKFKAITGKTLMTYVRYMRMSKAKDLLINSTDSVKDIAWKCGYADISHLSNSFKKKYGMSPNEYRKRLKH